MVLPSSTRFWILQRDLRSAGIFDVPRMSVALHRAAALGHLQIRGRSRASPHVVCDKKGGGRWTARCAQCLLWMTTDRCARPFRAYYAAGYQVRAFETAERFIEEQDADAPGCLLLDVCLPGLSGLDLQACLQRLPRARPIVFMTGTERHPNRRASHEGRSGRFSNKADRRKQTNRSDRASASMRRKQRRERAIRNMIQQRLKTLTRRERQVMTRVIRGQLNRQIAEEIGTGEKTVKVHRGRVMPKMGVRSVAELVQLAARVKIAIEPAWCAGVLALKWKQAQCPDGSIEQIRNTPYVAARRVIAASPTRNRFAQSLYAPISCKGR